MISLEAGLERKFFVLHSFSFLFLLEIAYPFFDCEYYPNENVVCISFEENSDSLDGNQWTVSGILRRI